MVSQVLRAIHSAAQPIATTRKTAAIMGLSALAIFVAIGIGKPGQALTAVLPTPAATRSFPDNGPFYFWRGMDMRQVARPPAAVTGFPGKKGMLVERVQAGSPAAHVRLEPGDIVSAIDGMPVNTARSPAMAIADHCCGPTVRLRVWRHHHVRVVELPSAIPRSERTAARNRVLPLRYRATGNQDLLA